MGAHPLATYRLQLHPGFDFDAAAGVVDYLAAPGVTHVYLSPVLQAAPGPTHGPNADGVWVERRQAAAAGSPPRSSPKRHSTSYGSTTEPAPT